MHSDAARGGGGSGGPQLLLHFDGDTQSGGWTTTPWACCVQDALLEGRRAEWPRADALLRAGEDGPLDDIAWQPPAERLRPAAQPAARRHAGQVPCARACGLGAQRGRTQLVLAGPRTALSMMPVQDLESAVLAAARNLDQTRVDCMYFGEPLLEQSPPLPELLTESTSPRWLAFMRELAAAAIEQLSEAALTALNEQLAGMGVRLRARS